MLIFEIDTQYMLSSSSIMQPSTQICVGSNRVYITVSSCASSRINISENMRKIATHLRSLSEKTRIIFLTSPPLNDPFVSELARTNERCRICSEACVKLCKEMNVKVVDLFTTIQMQDDWHTTCFT
ncbi:unnamed protein product [Musa acuminata subsp. malaccensis]|uniref:(wild Malaysian banana) hypothetical protein n=1 Tax=Musa acuminata subsp. malaccensis TaxID=214687 RepID=A0A804K788_MUSAM|nr:unnamed protein product [Musa acuminata subsp. malaccensis]